MRTFTSAPPTFAQPLFGLVALVTCVWLAAAAAADSPRTPSGGEEMLGGKPDFTWEHLPPGPLRDRISELDTAGRQRANERLRSFSFPAADLSSLRADSRGDLFYVCHIVPQSAASSVTPSVAASTPVLPFPTNLQFHSRPGATNVLYLDFDGEDVTGTAWNTSLGRTTIPATSFSTDSDHTTFNAAEQADILRIWLRVAEDYAPFAVDVTTERPAVFTTHTGHALITASLDADGNANPSSTAGGVGYVSVFGTSTYAQYRPVWIYYDNLAYDESYTAEAVAHELGHNLGLSHDGKRGGIEYYPGHGSGETSWAPIMGTGYDRNVTQWSQGDYYKADNHEDDLAIISGKLAYRPDDHGDTAAVATPLVVSSETNVISSTPDSDPDSVHTANKGIIEQNTDTDVFSFTTASGMVQLVVSPWIMPTGTRGGNLDILLELRNGSGTLLMTNNPPDQTGAELAATLDAGQYTLYVRNSGAGSPSTSTPTGYTSYGSLGQYFISGHLAAIPRRTLTVTPNNPAWGAVTPSSGVYTQGSTVALSALPGDYFRFVEWRGDASGSNPAVTVTMDSDKAIEGVFGEISTTNRLVPYWWLAQYGSTNDFETAAESAGSNGMALWESYVAGLTPTNATDTFTVTNVVPFTNGWVTLSWRSVSGRVYEVLGASDLATAFQPVDGATNLAWPVNQFSMPATTSTFLRLNVTIQH